MGSPEYASYTERYVVPGGAGANDGLSWATAWDLTQVAADLATTRSFNFSGAFTVSAAVSWAVAAAGTTPIRFLGWNSTKTALAATLAAAPTFNCASLAAGDFITSAAYQFYQGLNIYGGPASGLVGGISDYLIIRLCAFDSFATNGITIRHFPKILGCRTNNNGSSGLSVQNSSVVVGCEISNNAIGVNALAGTHITNSLLYNNPGHGIKVIGIQNGVFLSTIDSNGVAIEVSNSALCSMVANNITNNATGLQYMTHHPELLSHNNFFGNTQDFNLAHSTVVVNDYNENPGYTNLATGDAEISNANLIGVTVPDFGGGTTVNIGSWQGGAAPAAGGGLLIHPGMSGGLRG